MPQPSLIEVSVDNTEYSRYERKHDTITCTVVVVGGAPYSNETVYVELIKARRSRDAVVAVQELALNGPADPQEHVVTFYLPDIVDQDLINLVRRGKYFVRARYVEQAATAQIGVGPDALINLSSPGTNGNNLSVEVVVPAGNNPFAISRVGDAITISLATTGGVANNLVDNSAALISARLNSFIDLNAIATGSARLTSAQGPVFLTGGFDEVVGESSEDFNVRVVTVDSLKTDYLFGLPLRATNIKMPRSEPTQLTGVVFTEVSSGHPEGFGTLAYNYHVNHVSNAEATIGSGANGAVLIEAVEDYVGSAGNAATVVVTAPAGTSPLVVTELGPVLSVQLAVVGGVPDAAQNTATLIADAINTLTNFTATAAGTGADSISAAEDHTFTGGISDTIRSLSWKGGPTVTVGSAGTYVLRAGTSLGPSACKPFVTTPQNLDYVVVRVKSVALLPTFSVTEEILIETKKMDDDTLGRYIEDASEWLEKVFLPGVYLEPTIVSTDRDPTTVQFAAGINAPTPIFADGDFDELVSPLTYFVPKTSSWVGIDTPYRQLLRVDSLYGAIANTRVIDIDLEWIELSQQGGMIQLVPFNQEIAFNFVGLIWVNAIRGAVELPNFWHFVMVAGLRGTPGDLRMLIAKKAAIEALTQLATAFRPGLGSVSLSRDGVSESVSYNSAQQFGIYTAAINSHKDWLDDSGPRLRAKYVGTLMVVV